MNDSKSYYIYEWIRLDINEPFYVGKGKGNRYKRLNSRNEYFKNIYNKIPTTSRIILQNLNENEAHTYEKEYILKYKNSGYKLSNMTDGGEGVSGYKPTEEALKKNRMTYHGFDIEDFKDEIISMYVNQNISTYKIAMRFNVSDVIIGRVLKKFGVELRTSKDYGKYLTGSKRYNSKFIIVKCMNENTVHYFDSISLCGIWLAESGLVNHPNGGKKAVRTNLRTGNSYKGLLFYEITREEYYRFINKEVV